MFTPKTGQFFICSELFKKFKILITKLLLAYYVPGFVLRNGTVKKNKASLISTLRTHSSKDVGKSKISKIPDSD